jgi:hypothetical protein
MTVPLALYLALAVLVSRDVRSAAVFTCNTSVTGGRNSPVVCAALGNVFSATGGPFWQNAGGWAAAANGTPTNYCEFFGVGCDRDLLVALCVPALAQPLRTWR